LWERVVVPWGPHIQPYAIIRRWHLGISSCDTNPSHRRILSRCWGRDSNLVPRYLMWPRPPIATRLRCGGRARIRGCRYLNAETQNITVPGMLFLLLLLFLPADGMLPAKLRDEGPRL
jgi:hypothetical protein